MSACAERYGRRRGFTLVELMVAITGGLFVALIVFIVSRNTGRFYRNETRAGEATLGGIVGFERLRAEIGRAAFLSSPNLQTDPKVCRGPLGTTGWPGQLAALATARIDQNATTNNTLALPENDLSPDRIVLMGSFASVDQYPIRRVDTNGATGYRVTLATGNAAMARLGYDPAAPAPDRAAVLRSVFGTGRALRITDKKGFSYYGAITDVDTTSTADVILAPAPALPLATGTQVCEISGFCVGCMANVVNFVQYDVRPIAGAPELPSPNPYGPIYDDGGGAPFDADRTELARVELDINGTPIAGTLELIAEYVVDLQFGLIVDERSPATAEPLLRGFSPDDDLGAYANATVGNPGVQPERIRAIRTRLSVRSSEADREHGLNDDLVPGIAPGLHRVKLGDNAYARVRTVQSDIAINNTVGQTW